MDIEDYYELIEDRIDYLYISDIVSDNLDE